MLVVIVDAVRALLLVVLLLVALLLVALLLLLLLLLLPVAVLVKVLGKLQVVVAGYWG